jgi:imidazolonepropionase-like amidohydrolase
LRGSSLFAAVIAFRGATLIDGTGAPPVPNSLFVVEGGRIVSVGSATPEAMAKLPPGTQVIAGDGKWIVPGLIDAHVHAESDEDLRTMLNWGVTSVRLMAETVAASQRLAAGSRDRKDIPTVFPAAPIFTVRGGWWGGGEPADPDLNRFPETPDEARRSIRRAHELGAAEIKIMLDDMAWCRAPLPSLPKTSPAVLRALLEEAKAHGLQSIVHAPNLDDARAAIADGATALAHGVLEPLDDATIAAMKARPVYYVPTMDIFEFLADTAAFVDAILSDPAVTEPGALPASTAARLRDPGYAAGYRERYPNTGNVRARLPALAANLRRLHAAGVPIALGTDMWAFPGLAVSVEMDLYVRAGLTPLQALTAATKTAARSLGADDRGTLEAGRRADFLVLEKDPVTDVRNVRRLVDIYKGGVRVGRHAAR